MSCDDSSPRFFYFFSPFEQIVPFDHHHLLAACSVPLLFVVDDVDVDVVVSSFFGTRDVVDKVNSRFRGVHVLVLVQ